MATGRLSPISTLLCAALLLSGCESSETTGMAATPWKTPLYRDHPLAGQIWKPSEARFATNGEVYAALKKADFVLIGEKHDNADHHMLQARLVSELAALGRRPALIFEMLVETQQQALDAHIADHPGDAEGLGAAVGWDQSGWPDWSIYQPIAQQALSNGMPLLTGGLDRNVTKKIAREGTDAMGEERAATLMLKQPIAENMRDGMRQVIFDSHCQQLPESMLDPMLSVTLAKDAVMADRMIESRGPQGADVAVLIAGGGHVRGDWGVPFHLNRRASNTRIVTVGLIEVEKDVLDPAAHAAHYDGAIPFDFIWFTPRVDDNDPCEAYAEQLKRMREGQQETGKGESD